MTFDLQLPQLQQLDYILKRGKKPQTSHYCPRQAPGSKQVPIVATDDKREITVLLGI